MWLAVSGLNSDSAELLLGISPDVFVGPEGLYLVDLKRVHRYWALGEQHENMVALEAQWAFLRRTQPGAEALMAPTAALASFLMLTKTAPFEPLDKFKKFSMRDVQMAYQKMLLDQVVLFEQTQRSSSERLSFWSLLIEDLCDLGLVTLSELCNFPSEHELVQRWGKQLRDLLNIAKGLTDWQLKSFEPKLFFEARVNFALERELSSDAEPDLILRLQMIFNEWDHRLRLRKLRIAGIKVELRNYGTSRVDTIVLRVPRALVSAQGFVSILQEKLLTLGLREGVGSDESYADSVAEVSVRSMNLEPDFDIQLHLLEADQESLDQSWAQAVGHMYSFAKQDGELRFGAYVPCASYLPESSLQWADSVLDSPPPRFDDHPARPTLLLKNPEPMAIKPQPYDKFVEWASKEGLGLKLEKVFSPWMRDAGLRIYTRYQEQWVFWSSKDQRVYRHGYF